MADERTITTIFKADISQFSASTQDLNRYVKAVNSEFANATAHLGRWSDNTEGLQAKLNQLNGVLEAEKKKLGSLEDAYAKLVAEGKENTKEAQDLATAINNQGAKVKKTEADIERYTSSLKELEDAGVSTKKELDELNKELEEQKQNASDLGGGILKGLGVGIAGIGVACVGALAGLSSLVEETKELRTKMGQLDTTFQQQGHSVESAEKTFNDLVGVLGDTGKATEASMHLAQLAKSEEDLANYTDILTGVYATFGDSLPVEGLAEAMNHTANLGSVQGNLADALEWAGVNVDDFNEQLAGLNTEEERAQLIQDTLNGLYGDTATKYKEVNSEVIKANEAQNAYNQAMADIATKAQPIITEFKTAMVGVLQTILEKFNEVDISGLIGGIANMITTLVNVVLPPLMTALSWILDNLNWLAPLLGGFIGTIGAIVGAIKAYNAIVNIAKAVQLAWNLAMSANPIGLVITAVGALVAGIAILWNNCEGFRNFFLGMWDAIVSGVKAGVNGIIKFLNTLIGAINAVGDGLGFISGGALHFEVSKIPYLAKGGVVESPTLAMIGEAGKEAVLPLENNTEWLDKIADKLANKMNSSNVVNNFNYTFEKMETSRHALHKAQIETKRIVGR